MDILYYSDLEYSKVKKQFERTVGYLEAGNFAAADVKKLAVNGLYRAKLDQTSRLLFKFARYNDRNYLLLLEVIYNHEYGKSRFLRGAAIDEARLEPLQVEPVVTGRTGDGNGREGAGKTGDGNGREGDGKAGDGNVAAEELVYVNPNLVHFHLLDKAISFDDDQERLFRIKPPVIIIGSAGSGKTVLTLEKLKTLKGEGLYVTLSPFLVENSARLYYANNYENDRQEVDFLSFREFLESIKIIEGREIDYQAFERWLAPRSHSFGIRDHYKLYEEFRGVLTGRDITKEYLGRKDYLGLGIRQSIFLKDERGKVYDVFRKYLKFLEENHYYDLNMVSWWWLEHCKPRYDFIVIDEVQDFTNIQLYILLKSLKNSDHFMLCGDSNQNVHPNFFSWANVKTMFYKHHLSKSDIQVLRSNYRNSEDVTTVANKLLKIKNSRFGSIDRESTYLVDPVSSKKGEVHLLSDSREVRQQMNDRTMRSTRYAVLVMRPEEKAEARKIFKTPLIFSIQEAKGLEYPNIIALNFISGNSREFNEITSGVSLEDVNGDGITFSRGKEKSDKSLDAYKIFINSLYVAVTRSFEGLYLLESSRKHEILVMLGLTEQKESVSLKREESSKDEWQKEARKLEMQGKKEQAEEIRRSILEITDPDWEPVTPENIEDLKDQALDPDRYNKKAKDLLFAYALLYDGLESLMDLAELNYRRAERYESERGSVLRKYYSEYMSDNFPAVERNIRKYGVDYRDMLNMTPLMAAAKSGSVKILEFLTACGADASLTDNAGKNAFQIALYQSWSRPGYLRKLDKISTCLLTGHIKVSVDNSLIKINSHKIEYFLLNFFIALQHVIIYEKYDFFLSPKGVQAADLEKAVEDYPEALLPGYRKKRTYLSANLSKHEAGSGNPYNKKLFKRLYRGYYVLNPGLSVWVNEKWVKIYELMNSEEVKIPTRKERKTWLRGYWEELQEGDDPRFTRRDPFEEDHYYDWMYGEDKYRRYYDRDDEPESDPVDINAVIKEHYDELFDGDSDTEEGFKSKLYRVIRKVRRANAGNTYLEQEETGDLPETGDLGEETDALGEETKPEVTQFRLPFDD